MNLVFIYGPPATGKLTIASEIATRTGYKLFHNHLTQDLVREIYEEFGPTRFGLVTKIRLDVFEYAAQHGTDLIFTFVYDGDETDTLFMDNVHRIVEASGGNVKLIHLTAPIETLKERVTEESRKAHKKLHDVESLVRSLEETNQFQVYQNAPQLELDTSTLIVTESVEKIMQFIKS